MVRVDVISSNVRSVVIPILNAADVDENVENNELIDSCCTYSILGPRKQQGNPRQLSNETRILRGARQMCGMDI